MERRAIGGNSLHIEEDIELTELMQLTAYSLWQELIKLTQLESGQQVPVLCLFKEANN